MNLDFYSPGDSINSPDLILTLNTNKYKKKIDNKKGG